MGPNTRALVDLLIELEALPADENEMHRAGWLNESLARIRNLYFSAIELLLGAYGGMGSFNDLVLGWCCESGSISQRPNHLALNERSDRLDSRAWQLADDIRRKHEASGGPADTDRNE